MPKRHTIHSGDLESVFGRLEELVLANSGEDEFEEIFKLLIAKLLSELGPTGGGAFHAQADSARTADGINALLHEAACRWPGIFREAPESALTSEHLSVCVEALEGQKLLDSNLEVLDAAFEYLVRRVAKGEKGQYFTPRHVVDCCVRIVDPGPHESIIDPACGSAGFLIHALNHVRSRLPDLNVMEYSRRNLWGCDIDQRAARIAKALMTIAGAEGGNLYRLNSLLTPQASVNLFDYSDGGDTAPRLTIEDVARTQRKGHSGFDVVLTNPPFAGELREAHILRTYELFRPGRRIERDVLFIERCVNLLRPGGRLAIVLPHNKLASPSWSYVREWLLRRMQVVMVLGLGRNTFAPHTQQKASVLFATKRDRLARLPVSEDILFAVSERDGKDSTGRITPRANALPSEPAWSRADHDLDDAVAQFQEFRETAQITWGRRL